jgi:excisionase family DNA binding protein
MKDSSKPHSDAADSPWLSLRDASRQMGVSPATLRSWADGGRVPSYRTPGGHRRFRINPADAPLRDAHQGTEIRWRLLEHSALGRVRVALETETPQTSALTAVPPRARVEHRRLGRELIQLLVNALQQEDVEFGARADALGKTYATLHRRYGMERHAALSALGFFRNAFVASVIEFAFGLGEPGPDQLISWVVRANEIIDRVCISMLESLQEQPSLHGK